MSGGPAGRRSAGEPEPWGGVSPFSIKTKLGALVVIAVLITTGLMMIAMRTATELRFITVFSMIATLLITQFVAHSLTAPLDEMNAHVLQVTIPENSKMHGVYVSQLRLPAPSTIGLLLRDGEPVTVNPNVRLQSGDQLLIVAPEASVAGPDLTIEILAGLMTASVSCALLFAVFVSV